MVILTSLAVTLVVLSLALIVLAVRLTRRLTTV